MQAANLANQGATVARTRERKLAMLKDPITKEEVPLPPHAPAPSAEPSSRATTATSPASTVEHVHTLLRRILEDSDITRETAVLENGVGTCSISTTCRERQKG